MTNVVEFGFFTIGLDKHNKDKLERHRCPILTELSLEVGPPWKFLLKLAANRTMYSGRKNPRPS